MTKYKGAVRGEGVAEKEGLPLGVTPRGTRVLEGVGVFVGEGQFVAESEG